MNGLFFAQTEELGTYEITCGLAQRNMDGPFPNPRQHCVLRKRVRTSLRNPEGKYPSVGELMRLFG